MGIGDKKYKITIDELINNKDKYNNKEVILIKSKIDTVIKTRASNVLGNMFSNNHLNFIYLTLPENISNVDEIYLALQTFSSYSKKQLLDNQQKITTIDEIKVGTILYQNKFKNIRDELINQEVRVNKILQPGKEYELYYYNIGLTLNGDLEHMTLVKYNQVNLQGQYKNNNKASGTLYIHKITINNECITAKQKQ